MVREEQMGKENTMLKQVAPVAKLGAMPAEGCAYVCRASLVSAESALQWQVQRLLHMHRDTSVVQPSCPQPNRGY